MVSLGIACITVSTSLVGCAANSDTTTTESITTSPEITSTIQETTTETEKQEAYVFSTSDQELLSSLGLTDVHDLDVMDNGKMRIIRAKIFDSEDLQLNITQEDDHIIYVQLTGIAEDFDAYSNRTDKLDMGVGLQGKNQVDMYSDTEGGILAIINWGEKTLNKAN